MEAAAGPSVKQQSPAGGLERVKIYLVKYILGGRQSLQSCGHGQRVWRGGWRESEVFFQLNHPYKPLFKEPDLPLEWLEILGGYHGDVPVVHIPHCCVLPVYRLGHLHSVPEAISVPGSEVGALSPSQS